MSRWVGWAAAAVAGLVAVPMMFISLLMPAPRPPGLSLASAETPVCSVASVQKPSGALLSAKDVAAIAHRAGFRGEDITMAVAVARAESGWNPKAVNNANTNGTVDYGLMQINSIHEAILAGGNWADPEDNMKMAFKVWTDSGTWNPTWSTVKNGSYKKYMEEVEVKQECKAPVVKVAGTCKGKVANYENGLIPASALCSLWTNRNHRLRADAAATFDAMSKAYQAHSGQKLCLTDSYRSLAAQVDVKRRKGRLAATPGTSNHGWGLAVDLCRPGTQENPQPWNTGTDYDTWLHQNSQKYGWVHPSWAHAGGSKPESWHWGYKDGVHAP
jgi:hypothetical protein